MNDIIVPAELIAYDMMRMTGHVKGGDSTNSENIHVVANRFIELAERIKSERAVATMQGEP